LAVAADHRLEPGRSLATGVLIGVGLMAAIDEIVFHQILAWHHLYNHPSPAVARFFDGLLHTAELIALLIGFVALWRLRGRAALAPVSAWAGLFLGAGGFQVFDGVVVHKVLRLHQIRYGVELLPYDIAWNAAGLALIAIGALLARRRERRPSAVDR
jgi:uncharacterized membrane protein